MERDWCSYAWYVDTLMRNRDEFTVVNRSRAFPQVEAVEDVRHILTLRYPPFPLAFPWRFSNPVAPDEKLKKNCCKTAKDEEECCKKIWVRTTREPLFSPKVPSFRQLSCQDPLASIKSTLVIADTCTAPYFRLHLFARYISCTFRSAKPSKGTVYAFNIVPTNSSRSMDRIYYTTSFSCYCLDSQVCLYKYISPP